MKTLRLVWRCQILLAAMVGSPSLAGAATSLILSLVRADAPDKPVSSAEHGSVVPYSRYHGPVTTWAFGLGVDGKQFFDERDAQGKVVERRTQLELQLVDGEHTVEPIGYKFRVGGGKVESLSPELTAAGNRLQLRLFPVKFVTPAADGPQTPVRVRIAAERGELFHSPPATYAAPLVVYLPAAPTGGYSTNLSDQLLLISEQGASWAEPVGKPPAKSAIKLPAELSASADRFTVHVPTVHVTAVLLLDKPANMLAAQLAAREEATQNIDFEPKLGNWDPRARLTAHGTLSYSQAGWTILSGVPEWKLTAAEQAAFRHHVFFVDRPMFSAPDGKEKERVLHVALGNDSVTPGERVPARWHWIGQKGLEPAAEKTLVAFWQQAPTLADDAANWQPLEVAAGEPGYATLVMPAAARRPAEPGCVGLADGPTAKPNDRLLSELPLIVPGAPRAAENAAAPLPKPIVLGKPVAESRVPSANRQGVFLDPQNISAVDISPDGKFIGLTTMAFRNDRNFWLLSDDGQILWGRHVDPWAPFQAAVLPDGKTSAVGLAYSRFTDPSPTIAVVQSEKSDETALTDAFWNMGWLRYGSGDWRTGWPASLVGDVMVRAGGSLFTVCSQEGGRRFAADGKSQNYPLSYQRPYRMASSADGHVLAFGYLTPDASTLDEKTRSRMRLPPAMLTARDALTSAELWAVAARHLNSAGCTAARSGRRFSRAGGRVQYQAAGGNWCLFRAPASVALNGDGSMVAVAEYGGWVRVKGQRGIGSWNPDNQVFYCPRQRGKLRLFDARGAALAEAEFPAEGLFEVHLDRQGETVWCAPQAWFARGLAGKSWLPADPAASTVYAFDLARQSWRAACQFPDAVSDLAVAPDGRQVLVSCWDGKAYLLGSDGQVQAEVEVGDAARVAWSADGRFAVIGTQRGEVWSLDARGQVGWHTALPISPAPAVTEPAKPVFADVPIYSVGRVGTEHAYVGDMWLIKTDQGALMVDGGASSGIPITWQRMRAAGVEPDQLRYILLSHSHGDHGGSLYLWRTAGAKTVAPESAALTMNWLMPTWTDYSIWVPTPIDVPLPLKRVGDEAEVTLCGLKIKAIFVPGHSFDSVVYVMDFGGKRVAFTGDIGFEGESHILHRTWGDATKAQGVVQVIRDKVLPLKPDHVLTGHTPYPKGTEFLQSLVERTEAALTKSP